jgi:heme/copper-type cytochrome/quinol oxidase subunit 3
VSRRAVVLAAIAVTLSQLASFGAAFGRETTHVRENTVRRVLVISLPATSWADIKAGDDPNLKHLLADSAIADMVTRAAGRKNSIAGGYTALGAGGRASATTPLAAQAFETTEPYGDSAAGDVYRQRTGHTATSGLVHLGFDSLVKENAEGLYDPTIGALGDALAGHHVPRAVIANGDGAQPVVDDPLPEFQRAAVNALMGSDGHVPGGAVGDELLTADPHAPFGVRMDNDAAYRAFSRSWRDGGVVLVEGSDLLRADLYTDFLTDDEARVQKQAALHRTDELVGRMLADVDPTRDAVFVVSPASPRRGSGLAVSGIRAPGVAPELMRSATSRRNGFVYVIDIAPTILDLLGYPTPSDMEGETMEVVNGGVAHGDRIDMLIHANEDAVFRDSKVVTANNIVIGLSAALALAAVLAVRRARRRAAVARFLALAVLGFLFATYVAGPFHFGRSDNTAAYFGFLAGVAILFAAGCRLLGGRHRYLPLAIALAATVALHLGDLLAGARLELNTVFGYSATVGIRVSGQGNITFSQLTAAVLLLAGLAVWRRPGRTTVYAVIALLAVTLLVMAAPPFGGDFGAALAGAPGFGLFAWLLLGRRIRLKTVVILGAVLVVSGLLVGFADLMRPADQRTHVGRFFDKVATGGLGDFFLTLRRKLMENIDSFTGTKLLWVLPIVALLIWYLWRVPGGRARTLLTRVPVVRQTLLALAVVAFLGYALNDSGIAIPSLMAVVFECVLVYVVLVPAREPVTEPRLSPRDAPGAPALDDPREERTPQLV